MTPLIDDLKDALHRAFAALFPHRVRHNAAGRHHRSPGKPRMVLASTLPARLAAERKLRAECDRMAVLLSGVRRGRADAARFAHTVSRVKSAGRMPARARFASQRFLTVSRATRAAVRTGARETVAVAARAARQLGAPRHRHIPGTTDVHHNLVADLVAYAKSYEASRARGERSWWQQGRTRLA